jgi:hypothetical protein
MTNYLRIDMRGGRFFLEVYDGTTVHPVSDIQDPGDLTATVSNSRLYINSSSNNATYVNGFRDLDKVQTRPVGGSAWVTASESTIESTIQGVLDRESVPVVADSEYVLSDFIKPDLTTDKSETTDFVHGDSIANGGAVILSTESAKIGVQGNHIEFDSTGTYGDIDINVKTPSGNTDRAIHIFGTALQQAPTIEFEGPIIISASNGNRYYLKVSNTGGLYTEAV